MKYIGAFLLMLACNEILSIIALILMGCFFIYDAAKAGCLK